MSDNLTTVAIYSPKGRFERRRSLRVLGLKRAHIGMNVQASLDTIPFNWRGFVFMGNEKDGTPKLQVTTKATLRWPADNPPQANIQ